MKRRESLRHHDRGGLQDAEIRPIPQTLSHVPHDVRVARDDEHRIPRPLIADGRRGQRRRLVARQQLDLEAHPRRW
ncbi:MAG TPA: hypothetical protein VFW03_23955 [Gemmatimonadaceae bacterium]|nr:hypothetical protein [Gemmatimonadaceae bacterium]